MPPTSSEIPVAEDEICMSTIEVSDDRGTTTTTTHSTAAASYNCNKEKQISIDPISLKQPQNGVHHHENVVGASAASSIKPKLISASLPCSAVSSPRSTPSSLIMKNLKKWRNHTLPSPPPVVAHQHSVALSRLKLLQRESLRRSKSCGEGRASRPSIDDQFDFPVKSSTSKRESATIENMSDMQLDKGSSSSSTDPEPPRRSNAEEFKCGALSCLFLPNFSIKAKQVKPRRSEEEISDYSGDVIINNISNTVSLEKFECGSWSSSAMVKEGERDDSLNFFDLPMELIRGGGSGTNSPVTTAFVFEKKGVLKKNSTSRRSSSHETSTSNRHVRFSASPPTSYPSSPFCISPRLQKARAEFNAYLEEAQRA